MGREESIYGFGVPSQGCSPEPVLVGAVYPILSWKWRGAMEAPNLALDKTFAKEDYFKRKV